MNHYRHIDRQRIQFDFLVGENSDVVPTSEIEALGGRVFTVPHYQDIRGFAGGLRQVIRQTHPAIIHSHLNALSVVPLSVAREEHVAVRIAHSHSTAAPGEPVKNAAKAMLRPLAGLAPTECAACSVHAGAWLFGSRAVAEGRVHIVRNAVDLPSFIYSDERRSRVRAELGIPETAHVVGQVGRLSRQKNQLFLLPVLRKLARRHRQTVVLMVGDGDLRPRIAHEIARLGLADVVQLLGVRHDVPDLYQAMDVLALPSTYEGLGMVAVEAQASGLRVVASDTVPKEVAITDLVDFLPLAASIENWVTALEPTTAGATRQSRIKDIAAAGYDIDVSARELSDWYLRLVRQSANSLGTHLSLNRGAS